MIRPLARFATTQAALGMTLRLHRRGGRNGRPDRACARFLRPLWINTRPCLLGLALALAGPMFPAAAAQGPVRVDCPSIQIDAQAFSATEQRLIRESAGSARAFLQSHGVDLRETIRVGRLDADRFDRFPHIGSYSSEKQTIALLDLEQALRQGEDHTLFGLPLDEALYRSVVVHEIAHAITDQHFTIPNPSLVAQEYLAYVVQLSTMESRVREEILRGFALSAYKGIEEMSPVYYQMAPACFGVKAYLHFLALQDPGGFIRGLLSGAIRPTSPEME